MRSLPSALSSVDQEIQRSLEEGDQYVASRYVRIVKALAKKAEDGDKGASELLLKHVLAPKRDSITQTVQSQPERDPVRIRLNLYFMTLRQTKTLPSDASPFPLEQWELESLTDREREQLGTNYEILIGNTLVAPQTAPALPASAIPPNPQDNGGAGAILAKGVRTFVCEDCGEQSRCDTRAHNKVICDRCRKRRRARYWQGYKLRQRGKEQEVSSNGVQ